MEDDALTTKGALTPKSAHALRILTPDGVIAPGPWPFQFPLQSTTVNLNLSIVNMDSDDDLEIVFSRNQPSLEDPQEVGIHVFNLDGTYAIGWPQVMEGLADRIVVADLDADGSNEIVVGTRRPARVYILRSDGASFSDAWPRDFDTWVRGIATADLDGDGDLEILINDTISNSADPIHAIHHDATDLKGWPVWIPQAPDSGFAIGDTDGDGTPEIAFSALGFDTVNRVYLLNARGELFSSAWPLVFPLPTDIASVGFGDVDADGYLDLVATGTMPQVFAFDRDGSAVPGWPALIPFPKPGGLPFANRVQAIADVDADGMPEIIVGALIGPCIFNHDGTPLQGANPLPVNSTHNSAGGRQTLSVADVDLDGDVEILSGIWRTLYAWDFPGPECSVQWPRSSGNLGNTGAVTAPAVDTSEWVMFNTCLTGPNAAAIPPECTCLDADNDADIDLHDFAALQRTFE